MNAREFAEALGATHIIDMPNRQTVVDSAVTMRMMHTVLHAKLQPGQGKRPGRPSNPAWTLRRQVPFSEATWSLLERFAEALSTPERRVSPAQLAATLIEQVLATGGAPAAAGRAEEEAAPAAAG
jgi:hypothetical protein